MGNTYYVDFAAGSNTNNGTATATPWKHCPGDSNATNNPATTSLSAGDKVIFKGGVIYYGMMNLNWSGSADADASRIIYDGNSGTYVAAWGTGKAIVDGSSSRTRGFYSGSPRNYITINNFEICHIAHSSLVTAGVGIGSSSSASTGLKITNNYFHDIGNWNTTAGAEAIRSVWLIMPTNGLVDNNEITKACKVGIDIGGGVDTIVSNNYIHEYFCWGIDVSHNGRAHSGVIIRNNILKNGWYYDAEQGLIPTGAHGDVIFVRQGDNENEAGAGLAPIIEGNLCYNNITFTTFGGTALITVARCKNAIVRNNIIINAHSYFSMNVAYEAWETGHRVYNNTIYCPRSGCTGFRCSSGGSNPILFKNNLIVGYGAIENYSGSAMTCDYNIYYSTKSSSWGSTGSQMTWSQWRTSGQDTHGVTVGAIADMQFGSITGYPTDCGAMDLSVSGSSPAVDVGTILSDVTDDYLGITRPQGGGYDMGAYEYAESGIVAASASDGMEVSESNSAVKVGEGSPGRPSRYFQFF